MMTAIACGGDETGAPNGPDEPAAPSGDPDPDARVRFANPFGPSQGLDPHRSSSSADLAFLGPLYDTLILEMPDAELAPGLATDWSFDEAGTVLTLTIREGVTFHDGAALDAEVVRANLERGKTMDGSAVAPLLAVVESIKVTDPMTVELHLTHPDVTLLRVLAERPGMMISPDALNDEDLANNPVGAGMFQLAEFQPGDSVLYQRFTDYWSPDDVQVAELEILIQPDSTTRLNAMRNNELDITLLEPTRVAEVEGDDLTVLEFDTSGSIFIQLNRTRSEFGDVRVRRAMNYAIDRAGIAENLFLGYATPSEQFYPASFPAGHVPEIEGRYAHDTDRARALLEDAGLADGFSFEMIVLSGLSLEPLAEVVQAQLAEVGITVELTQVEAAQGLNGFYTDGSGDAMLSPYGGRSDPAMTAQLFFTEGAHSNPGDHVLDGFDEVNAAALIPAPDDERQERLHDLMRLVVEEAGIVILAQTRSLIVTQPNISGFHWPLRGQPDFRGVAANVGG